MKKILLLAFLLLLSLCIPVFGKDGPSWYQTESQHLELVLYEGLEKVADSLGIPAQAGLCTATIAAMRVPEKLIFRVRFGFLRAGIAILEAREGCDFRGKKRICLVSKAISNRFVSTFYPVRDIFLSVLDPVGRYPVFFEKHLREGGYRNDYWILFDQTNQTAHWADTTFGIPRFSHDILSAFYYARSLPLTPGDSSELESHTDRRNYPLLVRCLRKEKVKVPAGRFDCLVVEPVLRGVGLFAKQKGRLQIWLTDDERRIPVRMRSKIYFIGSLTVDLVSF